MGNDDPWHRRGRCGSAPEKQAHEGNRVPTARLIWRQVEEWAPSRSEDELETAQGVRPASNTLTRASIVRLPWFPAIAGFLVMFAATALRLADQSWSTDAGAHGPIVLATGGWLLYHNRLCLTDNSQPNWAILIPLCTVAWLVYVFGRALDYLFLEAAAIYGLFLLMVYRMAGLSELRRNAFPLLYLGLAIPLPGFAIHALISPLQMLVTSLAAALLASAGFLVEQHGLTLVVDGLQFLVEEACAGLNSIIGLIAICLFYIYVMRRGSPLYALALSVLAVPLAIAVNVLRVCLLVVVAHTLGAEAAQGLLHDMAGLALFGLSLLLIFGIDMMFQALRRPQQ